MIKDIKDKIGIDDICVVDFDSHIEANEEKTVLTP